MPDLGEFLRRRGADPAQRIGAGEFGMGRLQRVVAPAQRVVVGVRNDRRVLAVIAPVVLGDFGAEARMFRAGGFEREFFGGDRRMGRHGANLT